MSDDTAAGTVGPRQARELATIVLAAGEGRRYAASVSAAGFVATERRPASPKQLASIEGVPMLRRVLDLLEGLGEPEIVVLGAHAEQVRSALAATDSWRIVLARDWARGQGASLRAGLAAAPAADAALIVLGDLPWLKREAVDRVLEAADRRSEDVVRAFDGDTPAHPLLIRGEALERARSAPDAGLKAVFADTSVARVQCVGLGVARDVDTVSDLRVR